MVNMSNYPTNRYIDRNNKTVNIGDTVRSINYHEQDDYYYYVNEILLDGMIKIEYVLTGETYIVKCQDYEKIP